ncbi:extensin family protein [Ectothiorhodospira lacustris]|uniref:extensin-like domain-containing protein n=1 Tax=Ectothiorhodospira lacustris TaxID=2899127 RepID=UPI001EE84862|nr:extensin family protein [Ectothiorhodospira lacustris]MCG5502098.1 extensin family protein [Ectothiorhodospira lacustris]
MGKFILLLIIAVSGSAAIQRVWEAVPHHWAPWEPLAVDDPLTPVSKWKLRQLSHDRQGCLAALDTVPDGELTYVVLDDHEPVAGCPLENVVRVQASGVDFNAAFVASCPLALAWVIYERQRLQPAAEEVFGSRLTSVQHYGSYSCRNVYGREAGRLSEHATAEALDVAAFGFADGRRVTVLRNWDDDGEAGEFLRRARDGACDIFGNVLGPDYNAAHADHFHFGMRGFRLCR